MMVGFKPWGIQPFIGFQAGIPAFVQKFIFPVVLLFGKLAGKNRKFSNAPRSVPARIGPDG
jgi:hypothetical protein